MKGLTFKTIGSRLSFWFLIVSLVPLVITLSIVYFQQTNAIETETIDKLTAIRDLKVSRLQDWLAEREGDMLTIAEDFELNELANIIQYETYDSNDQQILFESRHLLNTFLENYPAYSELFIINPVNGKILASTKSFLEGEDKSTEDYFVNTMRNRTLFIKDIYYSKSVSDIAMVYSMPVFSDLNKDGDIIGVLVARIDLHNTLYKMLLDRVGLGKTGETLIVDENALALNELRWYDNAPLNLLIEALPAINAAQGKSGIVTSMDYRGEEVLAAYTYIPEMKWGFVCKQDQYELHAPIRKMMWNLVILFLFSGLVISFVSALISKSVSKPIIAMDKTAQAIKSGNLKARNAIAMDDELGSLATEFNSMADVIESKLLVQKGVANISEIMIDKSTLDDFGISVLKQLMQTTGADMSTFYVLNEATSQYEIYTSIGANESMLKPFNAIAPEGEFGRVISDKSIYHLKHIPDDTIFRYKATAGELIPKEIISIPIVVENNVAALISLVKIDRFNDDSLEIINLSWSVINTSYANLLASERLRVLAENLTNTNQQLEAQSEELQEQTEEMQVQAEELQASSEELQNQNLELEQQRRYVETANQLKSEFLSNMSHELRTPLNSIMALSRVLIMQANNKLDKDENSYLEIIERNGKRLLNLINDILDLSKIEAGKMEISPKRMSIATILNSVVENIRSLSDEKGLFLNLHLPENLPEIETEESKLQQVLTNIIGNAIKFTENGGVDIFVKSTVENVFIEVKDTGIGISEAMLPNIFDEFRQADGTSSRKYQGTGLGLSIAKKLTTLLGGKISVESQPEKGSVFTIALPHNFRDHVIPSVLPEIQDEKNKSNAKTILVVDDDQEMRRRISGFLADEGYRTLTATSGKEALEMAEINRPFAITLDIIMPEIDGWEVLQELKSSPKTNDIPVIVVSVSDDRDTGFALGAVGFINKPVDKKLLLNQIKSINKIPTTVMIVDDNSIDLQQMANIFKSESINTQLASGGKECLEILKSNIPDVLVLDLMMPEIDGFKVLKKIRQDVKTRDLPVVVVTAKDLSVEEKLELSHMVVSVITKDDSTPKVVLDEIKRVLVQLERNSALAIPVKGKPSPRILMVEDNRDAIIQVKTVLERVGYIVDVAGGGKEALEYVKNVIPDGIILDLMMPEIDGFEVLKNIRNTEATRKIPVLILTAKDLTKDDLNKLSANNIQQLIHKGDVDIDGLLFKVKMMLGNEPKTPVPISLPPEDSKGKEDENYAANTKVISQSKDLVKPDGDLMLKNIPTILVVEDNSDNMQTIKAILKGKYNIVEAYDGQQGLQQAISFLPDLILLDMSLPVIGGIDVVQKLKMTGATKHIPVIAVTAQAMKGDEQRFIRIGCDSYVSKPVNPLLLVDEIRKLLS